MNKPQPKAEIVVLIGSGGWLEIYCASKDAENWIKENAPEFGILYYPNSYKKEFTLFPSPLYELNEVKEYLEKGMNNDV